MPLDHEKNKKEDLDLGVFDLYDEYAHNRLDRRQFVGRLLPEKW